MKRPVALVLVLLLAVAVACGAEDDPTGGESADDTGDTADTGDTGDTGDDAAADEPIEIPDDALDWTGQAEVEVSVQDNTFEQREIVVSPGTAVTWTNEGVQPHNVKPSEEGAFEPVGTGELDPGVSQTRVFDEPGDYPYYCSLHGTPTRGQTGRVIVVGA